MNKIFIDGEAITSMKWSHYCAFKGPEGDDIDWCSVGCIFPWGGIELAKISDEVPEDEREEVAAMMADAPVMAKEIETLKELIDEKNKQLIDYMEEVKMLQEHNATLEEIIEYSGADVGEIWDVIQARKNNGT